MNELKMKNHLLKSILILATIYLHTVVFSQELPVLSPYHTNSFLYNPSLAGGMYKTNGSFMVAHKSSFAGITGNPVSNVFSAHVPVPKYTIGIGGNIFIDRTNILQTTYSSLGVAYHILLHDRKSVSFGLAADFYYLGVDMEKVDVAYDNIPDNKILQYNDGKLELDFSFGINYQSELFSCGATINRLRSFPLCIENTDYSNSFYSAYAKYAIPVILGRDLIEPMITYRQLPFTSPQGYLGLVYSYKHKNTLSRVKDSYWTLGAFMSTNNQLSFLMGVKLIKRIHLMYTFESSGKYQRYLGPSHEISLTYDMIILSLPDWNNEYLTWESRKSKIKRFFSLIKKSKTKK